MRKSIFAGKFYPENKQELEFSLKNLVNKNQEKRNAKAIIVPHAGYEFSGKTAGKAFSKLKDFNLAVIIGTNHNSSSVCISLEDFETPLGKIRNAEESGKLADSIEVNEEIHKKEHSIEVVLPFIQHLNPNAEIIPILPSMKKEENKELAKKIYNTIRRPFVFIISSDFTHAGNSYGFPISYERAGELDKLAIKNIEKLDEEGFWNIARKTTICGRNSILVGIELAKFLQLKPELVDISSSSSITGKKDFVNYVSIGFE